MKKTKNAGKRSGPQNSFSKFLRARERSANLLAQNRPNGPIPSSGADDPDRFAAHTVSGDYKQLSNPKCSISKEKIADADKAVADFLALKEENALTVAIRVCFAEWLSVRKHQEDNLRAREVLGAFFQSGKILDLLRQFSDYADRLDDTTPTEIARIEGYSNYLFFLEIQVKKLLENHTPLPEVSAPTSETVAPEMVAIFLSEACISLPFVKRLQAAREASGRLHHDKRGSYADYQMLLDGVKQIAQWTDEELQAIYQLQTALDQQLAAIADNIHRANKVYLSVQKLMPQSWFDSMNYKLENSSIFNMDTVQIRELYQTQLGEIREKMLAL